MIYLSKKYLTLYHLRYTITNGNGSDDKVYGRSVFVILYWEHCRLVIPVLRMAAVRAFKFPRCSCNFSAHVSSLSTLHACLVRLYDNFH